MIDQGLKQIAVATATPVLDRLLPVSTPPIVARGTQGLHVRLSLYGFPSVDSLDSFERTLVLQSCKDDRSFA